MVGGPPPQYQRGQGQNQYSQGNFRGPPHGQGGPSGVRREFHPFCQRWHARVQCWSEGQGYGCSNCGGNHSTDKCRQPNKMIRLPHPVAKPYQQTRDNVRGLRPQGGPSNDLRPPNLYYDHANSRQTFHHPVGLQTANGYVPIQSRHVGPQPQEDRGQGPANDSGPSTSQDIRFMGVPTDPHLGEEALPQVAQGEEQNQWPPNANVITYELRGFDEEWRPQAPAFAVTTRAMRSNLQAEREMEGQEECSSDEASHFLDLEGIARTAWRTTEALERENVIIQDRERPPSVHEGEGSEMGEWEGPGIPKEEFEGIRHTRTKKKEGYDLWADLSSLKADITFEQLLEISLVAQKTLKEGMPITRRAKKVRIRVATTVPVPGKSRDVEAVEIEVIVVDKVVPNVLVDGGSGLNILPEHTMKKLGLSLTGPSPFVINMANQSPSTPLGMIKDCRITTGGEEYIVIFHVIKMHSDKDAFSILLGRPCLRMADVIVDWRGVKPSITYGPKENKVKVYIGSLGRWVRKEIIHFSDEGEEKINED